MKSQIEIVADDGRRMGVRVAPYRSRTHLVILDLDDHPWFITTANMPPTENGWIHAVASLPIDEPDYHWDTPRYRDLCVEGGLDPDHGRPRFDDGDRIAATALLTAVNLTSGAPSPAASNILLDLLDLMRTDGGGHAVSVEALKQGFAAEARANPKVAEEVLAIVSCIPGLRRELLTDTATAL